MKTFLKRLGRALLDIVTSKKAIGAISGVVAHQLGADPEVVGVIAAYVVGQGLADHGKEAAKKTGKVDKHGAVTP